MIEESEMARASASFMLKYGQTRGWALGFSLKGAEAIEVLEVHVHVEEV